MPVTVRRTLLLLAVLTTTAGVGWVVLRPHPPEVPVVSPFRGDLELTAVNTRAGTVRAPQRARLAPQTGGRIARLPVAEGSVVATGDVLLELWREDLRADLRLVLAQLERARALEDEAASEAAHLEVEAVREAELQQREARSDRLAEAARAAAAGAAARHRAARAQVTLEEARVATIEAALERMVLRAPFAGIVASVTGEVGEYVMPSPPGIPTPPAIDLIGVGPVYVRAPIDEVDGAAVHLGQVVRVTFDAHGDRVFAGIVRRVAPFVSEWEKQARTVDVDVDLVAPPAGVVILPGASADVEIVLETRRSVLQIPAVALRDDGTVLLVTADNTISPRAVTAGARTWEFVEILDGLQPADRVVLHPQSLDLAPGAVIVPVVRELP